MGAILKLRITGGITEDGSAAVPRIGWKYTDGFDTYNSIEFSWVPERSAPFECTKWVDDYNLELKRAIELDLIPSGEWSVTSDGYYLYIESNVVGRTFSPYIIYNTVTYTAEIDNTSDVQIDFINPIESGALLNAYNDNILRFTSEGLNKVDLTSNEELPITLFPSPSGEFYLNLKDAATTLINHNKFEDEIIPDIETSGYVYPDPSLFLEMALEFSYLNFNQKASFYFLKSVAQIANYTEKNISKNYVLIPKVTYYEGYPFDVPVFVSKAQQVTIKNKTTGHSTAVNVERFVNRLFLSQGSQNFTIDDVLPMQTGINRLELEFGPTDKKDLVVQKKESKCAPYFKFYRNGGGFGYIRFESEVGVRNSAQEDEYIRTDFNGIQNTLRRSISDKKTTVRMELQTEALEAWEMENFQDFISSPRVEMYVSDLFQKQTAKSWVGVNVTSKSIDTKKPKASKLREKVTVEFELYNLHL